MNDNIDFRKKILCAFTGNKIDSCVEKYLLLPSTFLQDFNYQLIITKKYLSEPYPPHSVLLFRPISELESLLVELKSLKEFNIPVKIFYDDLLPILHPQTLPLLEQIFSFTDAIIVTTSTLKEWFSSYHSNVIHESTFIEKQLMDSVKSFSTHPDKLTILIAQSNGLGIFQLTELFHKITKSQYLKQLFSNVQFVIIYYQIANLRPHFIKFHDLDITLIEYCPLATLYSLIKGSYILLAPAHENDIYFLPSNLRKLWLDSKSCIKYLMAMAAKTLFVGSSNLLEYKTHVKHNETGFLFNNVDECLEILITLLKNPELRNRIIEQAYQELPNWDESKAKILMQRFIE